MSRARATVYGFIVIFGIPLLGLFWLISAIPPVTWAFFLSCLVALLVALLFISWIWLTFTPGGQAEWAEVSRRVRVRSLQHEVSRLKSEVFATEFALRSAQSSLAEAGYSGHGGSRIHEIPPLGYLE